MHSNGLILWNDYYPKEYLEKLINKNKLYIIEDKGCIIGLFELDDSDESSEYYNWNIKDKYVYLKMFCINVDFLHQGYGYNSLILLSKILKEKNYKSIRLIVYDKNESAIRLYNKVGFNRVDGEYTYINPYVKEIPRLMYGMEYKI